MNLRLIFLLFVTVWSACAAPLVEKTWLFSTRDTLTIDLRLAPGTEPDWSASSVALQRTDSTPGPKIPLATAGFALVPDYSAFRGRVTLPDVLLWSPEMPVRYDVAIELVARDGRRETIHQRTGFRSFETRHGQLVLNGQPIFLRGLAINPPNRGIPEALERSAAFARDYVGYLKSLHVNIIRIPDDETWYDVCDELGMMVFGGNYGGRVHGAGSEGDRAAAARWFREEKFHPLTRHPSLVIYALTNEVSGEGAAGAKWDAFLGAVHQQLRPWDPTRLYIANAGYGYGRVGDINDLHRYWGWYYQSPFTFLNLRDDPKLVAPDKIQPLTFTECVGNYNGPDGRTNLTPNHKNPVSQLNWLGHAPTSEQGQLGFEHQSFTIRQATELFRRLRPHNSELSGVFPFTILFNHWHDITSFADMGPKPAADQLRLSYQPVLLSWELYTTQVYAGSELQPIAHLINDSDTKADVQAAVLTYELRDSAQRAVLAGKISELNVAYYKTERRPLTLRLPDGLATGPYTLWGRLTAGPRVLSENQVGLFIATPDYARSGRAVAGRMRLFDPTGPTRRALERAGITTEPMAANGTLTGDTPLIIGEDAARLLDADQVHAVREFAQQGGRVLLLRQSCEQPGAVAALLPAPVRMPRTRVDDPAYPPPPRPSRDSTHINPERPDHPVFAGIDRRQLRVWSDFTGWDEQKKGFPRIHPVTDGYVLTQKTDIRNVAVLANYSQGLEGIALAEFFTGEGSVLYSAFELVARAGLDPVADRLLRNLISYTATREGHERHVLIDAPIVWGQYETEHGILTGINSGLMLNSRPALTGTYRETIPLTVTKEGHEFAGGPGGWNSRPGIVYVPFGRRPFGPYIHRAWSGTPESETEGTVGSAQFWCRIPAGKTQVHHRVFNPATEPLPVEIAVNGQAISAQIKPGATQLVELPIPAGTTTIETTVRGDRRLVLLETAFE
jgi:beta-galactosidase